MKHSPLALTYLHVMKKVPSGSIPCCLRASVSVPASVSLSMSAQRYEEWRATPALLTAYLKIN